jgi:hypothetical protein
LPHGSYGRVLLVGQEYEQASNRLEDKSTPLAVYKIAPNYQLCQAKQYV